MRIRQVIIQVGSRSTKLAPSPGVEVYYVDGPDSEDRIDMALLNDLQMPLKLVFLGGDDARHFAELYHGEWIEDDPVRSFNP